ncbi:hypothetical protein SAMN05444159_0923 [Bradyrhizobium lablabi]|uniref:Uncharacterized protein n=1 Tax=Bradyrhizobium lablabi TaxID=722472 RepID=A0A1M6KB57_9BRAD|nr:hypothetical protein SAMN05444159_0923 [Bradyrhizobium lablabi]
MSEYLASLVTRALAPELSVRPRLSSVFDPPTRAPGWEMSAPAPLDESVEVEFEGFTPRRAAAALAPDRRPQSPATFDATATDPDDNDGPALIPRHPAATSAARAAKDTVSEDGETHPMSSHENGAQSEPTVLAEQPGPSRKRPGRESPFKTGGNESAALPGRSNDKPNETGIESRAAPGQTDGAASQQLRTALHRPDLRRPFGQDAPTARLEATAAEFALPRERSKPDPGRVGPIEPELARQIRQRERSLPSETEDGSAIGRLSVLATKPRPADAQRSTSEATHATLATPSRREREQREPWDQRVSQASPSTIEVTIGRIEVRATSVAEPRQKPRPSSGATSLEDYLRQRSGRSGS